ncbi:hypothetical protein PV332_16215 [Streptomyces scabiei]|nr:MULTISPECIES: hypothetical protein [Streptomyces]MDW8478277.1 hypothetical protein [Streptomyces scabiei]MDX2538487.1 hypothetical protein [Streptomyces scabiei]MDX2565759.1 hypothetical protein [Streptomyces scabiei]MDX2577002.1 hypothetical protein [Streptomyces scabiei]MDX2630185.1 hypothetical protein [Streptomyces scabiei]
MADPARDCKALPSTAGTRTDTPPLTVQQIAVVVAWTVDVRVR